MGTVKDLQKLKREIKNTFTEFMLTQMGVPKATIGSYWELFEKGIWRIEKLFQVKNKYATRFPHVLFIQIPKTASSSINSILEQTGGHKTALEWREKLGEEAFGNLFKFAVVRDPYERFVSAYYHSSFDEPMNENIQGALSSGKIVFKPQHEFVYDSRGNKLVDFIGRFERLDHYWEFIKRKIKTEKDLPHIHQAPFKGKLTAKSKDVIHEYYKKDFEIFDYKII